MRRARRTRLFHALAGTAFVYGCAADGETPDCPPLRLYDVRNPQSVAAARAEMRAAAAKGCITLPAGFDADSGAAGAGGDADSGVAGAGSDADSGAAGAGSDR